MSTVIVHPGVCGMEAKIVVHKKDRKTSEIHIESKCNHINQMAEELKELNGMNECFSKFSSSLVYQVTDKYCKHLACPVPSAIIKAIEVEMGLALPRNVEMIITKE
ncbi:cell wall assembly regulator SMI1 [Anaerosolibacter carboniphilus]|uniref:Cell wall assembly regulator SMI1 n=1 Tax=Anaerosolibacter carboniphilus TaxID=1417629 RepID=A0A841KVB6_9FIRM|nr:hypothetical protein [Anaerosolibacter carboniphilus]MBB6217317.1 cell wall assembly regulator SMI1 [Anaerosolibacter carboniphilus]